MSAPVDVLAVMDIDARAVAIVADGCVGLRKKQWEHHLIVHDDARGAVAALVKQARMAASTLEECAVDLAADCGHRELLAALKPFGD